MDYKIGIVPFINRRKLDDTVIPKLVGKVAMSKERKYMGVTLTANLALNSISNILQTRRLELTTRRMCGKTWGLKLKMEHGLYSTVSRPMLRWYRGKKPKSCLNKLQRLACCEGGGTAILLQDACARA